MESFRLRHLYGNATDMKTIRSIFQTKTLLFLMAITFCFSLQSFKNISGIQIEKRHYRKGYYIHFIHPVKTEPVYQPDVSSKTKKEKPAIVQQQKSGQQNAPQRQIQAEPQRNMPTSSARVPSN